MDDFNYGDMHADLENFYGEEEDDDDDGSPHGIHDMFGVEDEDENDDPDFGMEILSGRDPLARLYRPAPRMIASIRPARVHGSGFDHHIRNLPDILGMRGGPGGLPRFVQRGGAGETTTQYLRHLEERLSELQHGLRGVENAINFNFMNMERGLPCK